MKDFYSFDELSIPLWIKALFWGLYMVIFVYTVWKTILAKHKDKQNMEVSKLFVLYFALYAVFYCVNPDYFSYRNWMSGLDITIWEKEKGSQEAFDQFRKGIQSVCLAEEGRI